MMRLFRRGTCWIGRLLFVNLLILASPSIGAELFWTTSFGSELLEGANKDGTNYTTLVDLDSVFGPQEYVPQGITIYNDLLIWTDIGPSAIYQSNLDGSDAALLLDTTTVGSIQPRDVVTDGVFLYWSDDLTEAIYRSNLDGTDALELIDIIAEFVPDDYDPDGIALSKGKLYWVDSFQRGIYRANSDGTDVIELIDLESSLGAGSYQPVGIVVSEESIYWTDANQDGIYRSNLDGSGATKIIDMVSEFGAGSYLPVGIDTDGVFLYWTNAIVGPKGVYRSNLDGTNAMKILDARSDTVWIAVLPVPEASTAYLLCIGICCLLSRVRGTRGERVPEKVSGTAEIGR